MTILPKHLKEALHDYERYFADIHSACERYTGSPIEAMMLAAIWHASIVHGERFIIAVGGNVPSRPPNDYSIIAVAQAKIGKYRADFALINADGAMIVVECDGHDFHEKTKEQAAHDKSRDRFFQDLGWKVYRFTGSEIYASPLTCANAVLQSLWEDA